MDEDPSKIDKETEPQPGGGITEGAKSPNPISGLDRQIVNEEMLNPAFVKMLLGQNDQYQRELSELQDYRDRFHEADKDCAVLREASRKSTAVEVLYAAALCIGSVALGLTPGLKSSKPYDLITFGLGAVLIVLAVIARSRK